MMNPFIYQDLFCWCMQNHKWLKNSGKLPIYIWASLDNLQIPHNLLLLNNHNTIILYISKIIQIFYKWECFFFHRASETLFLFYLNCIQHPKIWIFLSFCWCHVFKFLEINYHKSLKICFWKKTCFSASKQPWFNDFFWNVWCCEDIYSLFKQKNKQNL